jgi:hypothetical protein
MKRSAILVAVLLGAIAYAQVPTPTYNVPAAMQWLQTMGGCQNASQNPTCPGGYGCYDDEFTARMLAAGGVIALDPNVVGSGPYQNYQFNGTTYDLTTQTGPPAGLQDFLQNIGWYRPSLPNCSPENPDACYPAGAVLMTTNTWQQPIPLVAIGNSLCSCYSPLTTDGPHCDMPCSFFNGQDLYYPPPAVVRGPLLGSYTPNNQTFQDMTTYPNMFNTPSDSINMAVSVVEVGWSANDWPSVEQQLNTVWNIEMAVPLITWMPYAYKTWSSPTPNKDIVLGKYDDYIAQFLGNLSTWVAGKRAYLRFAPQPNGDWFPWSPVCGACSGNGQSINQTVASYSAMWTYIMTKVRSSKYNLGTDVLQVMFDVNNANAPDSAAGHEFLPHVAYHHQLDRHHGVQLGNHPARQHVEYPHRGVPDDAQLDDRGGPREAGGAVLCLDEHSQGRVGEGRLDWHAVPVRHDSAGEDVGVPQRRLQHRLGVLRRRDGSHPHGTRRCLVFPIMCIPRGPPPSTTRRTVCRGRIAPTRSTSRRRCSRANKKKNTERSD